MHIKKNLRAHIKKEIRREFVVYLADVWLETPRKEAVPFWWCGRENPDGLNPPGLKEKKTGRYRNEATFIEAMNERGVNWNANNQCLHRFRFRIGDNSDDYVENYVLMFGYHEIKD